MNVTSTDLVLRFNQLGMNMKKAGIIFFVSILLSVATINAHAFDAKRQGFQAGIGIGAHTSSINQVTNPHPSSIESQQELAVDFQLGYGFSNRIVGFIGGKSGSALIDGRTGTVSISGLGGTIYWSESSPSLYLTGMAGRGSLSIQNEDSELSDSGAGWLAGVGFEVTKGLHVELSYARADLVDPRNESNTSALESAFATVKYVWY